MYHDFGIMHDYPISTSLKYSFKQYLLENGVNEKFSERASGLVALYYSESVRPDGKITHSGDHVAAKVVQCILDASKVNEEWTDIISNPFNKMYLAVQKLTTIVD